MERIKWIIILVCLQTPQMLMQDLEEDDDEDEIPGTPPAKRVG